MPSEARRTCSPCPWETPATSRPTGAASSSTTPAVASPRGPGCSACRPRGRPRLGDGRRVERPQTVASAIRIGNPASWQRAVTAVRESGGLFAKVSDEAILAAQKQLAAEEGLLVEPASAAGLAGLQQMAAAQPFNGETVVCILTGHGLKDPESLLRAGTLPAPVTPTFDAVRRVIEPMLG